MNTPIHVLIVTGVVACALGGSAALADGEERFSTQDLLQRIADLEAKSARDEQRNAELESRVDSLEAEKNTNWITEQRATEIRQLVTDVLADADTRTSTLGAIQAGYDDGFILASADGNWLLRTNLLMQERFMLSEQSNAPAGTDDSRWGFENARTKFMLSGNVINPDWFYRVEIEVAANDTGFPSGQTRSGLNDAYVGYDFGQGWRLWFGTFKAPLLREELMDSAYQLAVERSVVNYVYTGGYTDGMVVDYRNAKFHVVGSYNNGINDAVYGGAVMTGGTSPITSGTADFAATFRGEWLINGEWLNLDEFTSPRGEDKSMMLGGALHYQVADTAATGVADLDLLLLTMDFSAQFGGANLFAALIYANSDQTPGTDANAWGVVVQGGYYFAETWEAYLRYEWSDTDTLATSDISIATIGFNKYLHNQNAKWSTDFGLGFDPVPYTVPITGWRMDSPGEDHQFVVRSQLQILF